ncbi:hypothetical protein BC936DRAFT_143520, partial [Jimgerdemannia flammicorona]
MQYLTLDVLSFINPQSDNATNMTKAFELSKEKLFKKAIRSKKSRAYIRTSETFLDSAKLLKCSLLLLSIDLFLKENSLTYKDWEEITSEILVAENYPTLNFLNSQPLDLTTILDPHIKINFNIYQKNIRKTNITSFEEFLDLIEEELKSTSELVNTINVDQEIKLFFDTPIADQRKSHEKEFLTLAAIVRDRLAITVSSIPCESLFSIAGNTTISRNCKSTFMFKI